MPDPHCAFSLQVMPGGLAAQVPAEQKPVTQSVATRQSLPMAQAIHEPPQSTSVSLPSRSWSAQRAATQSAVHTAISDDVLAESSHAAASNAPASNIHRIGKFSV